MDFSATWPFAGEWRPIQLSGPKFDAPKIELGCVSQKKLQTWQNYLSSIAPRCLVRHEQLATIVLHLDRKNLALLSMEE